MSELKKARTDAILMLAIVLLSAAMYFYLIPREIPVSARSIQDPFTPRTFPALIVMGIGILALIGLVSYSLQYFRLKKALQDLPANGETGRKKSAKEIIAVLMPYFFFALILLYYFLFTHMGYIPATLLVPPVMLLILGCRKWYLYAAVYVFSALMYLLFRFVLLVPLP